MQASKQGNLSLARLVSLLFSTGCPRQKIEEGRGLNCTRREKRTPHLSPAVCVRHVYSNGVCVGQWKGCVAYVFSDLAHCGLEQPHSDKLFKGYY